jgi:hypothetical protein
MPAAPRIRLSPLGNSGGLTDHNENRWRGEIWRRISYDATRGIKAITSMYLI